MSEKTIQTYQVTDTPFTIIEIVEEGKFKITIANNIVSTKEFTSKQAAIKYVKSRPWDLILNVTAMFTDFAIKNQSKL